MINHLKKKLLFRYALILFSVSLLIFWGGYAAYRIISRNVITSSLRDYLQEEVFEFKQEYSELEIKPERIAVAARNKPFITYEKQKKAKIGNFKQLNCGIMTSAGGFWLYPKAGRTNQAENISGLWFC